MTVDYENYMALYGDDSMPETVFNRLSWYAENELRNATTTVDGVCKLTECHPEEEYDAEAVKRCFCSVMTDLYRIEEAEKSAMNAAQFEQTQNGTRGKIISSVSSGSESISYTVAKDTTTYGKAAESRETKRALIQNTISSALSGIKDRNGVSMLYAGRYPWRARI